MSALAKTMERLIDRLITAEHARDAAIVQRDEALSEVDHYRTELHREWDAMEEMTAARERCRALLAYARGAILALRAQRDEAIAEANDLDDQAADHKYHRLTMMSHLITRDQIRLRTLRVAQRYRRTIARLRETLAAQNGEIEQHEQERWAAIDTAAALAVAEQERDALRAEIAALRAARPASPEEIMEEILDEIVREQPPAPRTPRGRRGRRKGESR